jgi:serine protease Do
LVTLKDAVYSIEGRTGSGRTREAMKISQRLTGLGLALLLTSPAYAERPKTSPMKMFSEMQQLIVSLSNRIKPAVVHVDVVTRRGEERHHVMGSGLILSSDGTIVTNHHVIDLAEKIEVILDDKTRYDATVMRQDRQTDLALLKIKVSHPLPFAKLGDSDKVQVGQWVLAIGNPFGFDRTVSFGIISGKGRFIPDADSEVRLLNDFLQTDAMIDPGNSGGPLVNLDGEVIGINSAGMGRGQGFTIPSKVGSSAAGSAYIPSRSPVRWRFTWASPACTPCWCRTCCPTPRPRGPGSRAEIF